MEVHGRLGLPISDHFTDIADLLGSDTRMRVWWRNSDAWRVDKLLPTGEVDLFHHGRATIRWDYERAEAQSGIDPGSGCRATPTCCPPRWRGRALTDADPGDVSRLPARRIAGHDALGLRLQPNDPRTSIDHVDLWADPDTGLVLALDAYGDARSRRSARRSPASTCSRPPARATSSTAPAVCIRPSTTCSTSPTQRTSTRRSSRPTPSRGCHAPPPRRQAVGIYGSGLTQVHGRCRCSRAMPATSPTSSRTSGAREIDGQLVLRVGPLGVALTFSTQPFDFAWVIAGTVTDDALVQAAHDLDAGARYRG